MTKDTTIGDSGDSRLDGLHWIRCSSYELRDGLLCPAAQATIEAYDPWLVDRQAHSPEERPYRRLLRLAQQIDVQSAPLKLPARQWQQLSDWLAENGLLGILPHQLLEFTTGPVWHETPLELMPTRKRGVKRLAPHQRRVTWGPRGWQTTYSKVGPEQPLRTARPGEAVRDPASLNLFSRPDECLLHSWPNGTLERQDLDHGLGAFFRGSDYYASGQRDYPSPARVEFWQHYGEPITGFLGWARLVAKSIASLDGWRSHEPSAVVGASRGLEYLNRAAAPTSLGLGAAQPSDPLRLLWASPSLFATFAVMALQDLAGGQRVMRCPVCGGVFLSGAHQAKFCSTTCRYTYHKREQRRREASPGGVQ